MKLKDFRVGWRTLVQEPFYSLVVVAGLGVGMAAAMLLLAFVRYSFEYNSHVQDVEHVYVVKHRSNMDTTRPWFELAPVLLRRTAGQIPGIRAAGGYIPIRPQGSRFAVKVDGRLHEVTGIITLPGFAEVLGLRASQGDLATALERPDSVVLSEPTAQDLFGTRQAVGRTLHAEGKPLRVAAVLPAPPANSTIPFDMLVGMHSMLVDENMRKEMLSGDQGWMGKLLLRVQPGASLPLITDTLQQAVDRTAIFGNPPPQVKAKLGGRKLLEIALGPLRDAYFDRDVSDNFISSAGHRGDRAQLAGLALLAVLIVALAAANYVNLAVLRIARRQREVAVRKALGATARRLVLQLLAESLLVSLAATVLGLLLAWLSLPLFGELMDRQLDGVLGVENIAAALGIGLLLGGLTALYPAWTALCVHPAEVLAGKPDAESRQGIAVRRALTTLQMAAAMGIAGLALAVAWQTIFMRGSGPGFDPARLLVLELPEEGRADGRSARFQSALEALPGVAGLVATDDPVGRSRFAQAREISVPGGRPVSMDIRYVEPAFFRVYGLHAVAGRLFDRRMDKVGQPGAVVVNVQAARELGFADPAAVVGQAVQFMQFDGKLVTRHIVGVAPKVRFRTLREAPRPVVYEVPGWEGSPTVTVLSEVPVSELEPRILALWRQHFPDTLPSLERAGDIIAANYAEEDRMSKLLGFAAAIALTIAAFGTYVMAAHTVQRRAREIVLRKLHGAKPGRIALLVFRETGALAAAAAALAMPLAWIAMERYLSHYVERAPIGTWTLLAALAATLLVAALAVGRHAWIAMRMRPAAALRA